MDVNVGAIARPAETGGQRRNRLQLGQSALLLVVSERGQLRIEFADDVREFARRMKNEMARPCAGFRREKTVRNEFSVLQVDAIYHHFVNAEIGREYVPPRGVGYCAM